LNSIAENERINYIEAPSREEIEKYGLKGAERKAEERKSKLIELKKLIKNSAFPVRENYASPKVLCELVLRDLQDVINRLYPEGEKLDPLKQARFEHKAFAQSRFDVYIERIKLFDKLDSHVKDNGLPLVVVGDSGSGKSALLANWANKYEESGVEEPFILVHHIGATPDSVDWQSMLRRIMGEMKLHFGIPQDIPDKPDELKATFANWLHLVAAKGRMVLIIDALNQLEDRDGALGLFWLPEIIPPNIRLIVSSLPGQSLDELNKRDWSTLEVKPLEIDERQKLIVDYLKQYSRNLSNQMIEHIASCSQTSNPLYLRVLLEEMRLHGDHFTLLQRVDHYLAAPTVDALYEKILERYEQDYGRDRKNLVRDAFSNLWAARKGLSDIELREILGHDGKPLPGAFWFPLYLAAEKSLVVNRSGLLNFSHDYLRNAVEKRYLKEEGEEQRYHRLLADYFEKRELSKRKVEELPWQLSKAKSWNRLVLGVDRK
jgi:nephrocystin-3